MRFSDYVDATPKHFSCSPRAVASLRLQPKSNRETVRFTSSRALWPADKDMSPRRSTATSHQTGPVMGCQRFRAPFTLRMRATVGRWLCSIPSRSRFSAPPRPPPFPPVIWRDRMHPPQPSAVRRAGSAPVQGPPACAETSERFRLGY
jgi:hypothetical protein